VIEFEKPVQPHEPWGLFESSAGSYLQSCWRPRKDKLIAHPTQLLVELDRTNRDTTGKQTQFGTTPDDDFDKDFFQKLGESTKELARRLSFYLFDQYHVQNEVQHGVGIQYIKNVKWQQLIVIIYNYF